MSSLIYYVCITVFSIVIIVTCLGIILQVFKSKEKVRNTKAGGLVQSNSDTQIVLAEMPGKNVDSPVQLSYIDTFSAIYRTSEQHPDLPKMSNSSYRPDSITINEDNMLIKLGLHLHKSGTFAQNSPTSESLKYLQNFQDVHSVNDMMTEEARRSVIKYLNNYGIIGNDLESPTNQDDFGSSDKCTNHEYLHYVDNG